MLCSEAVHEPDFGVQCDIGKQVEPAQLTVGQEWVTDWAGRKPPSIKATGERDEEGDSSVDPVGGKDTKRKKPRGGFRVDHKHLGAEEQRSMYIPERMES